MSDLLIKNWSKADWKELLKWAKIGANNAMIGEFTEVEEQQADVPWWIPVTERLPEPMTYVLLVIRRMGKEYRHDPFISTGYMSINKVDWWCSHDGSCSGNRVEVTHWMPLPKLPKRET